MFTIKKQSIKKTPIRDLDEKLDIIDHVNQDHTDELLVLTQALTPHSNAEEAKIKDLFREGALLEIRLSGGSTIESYVPFQLKGELEEQIIYLAFIAATKQGKVLGGGQVKRFFSVSSTENITENMLRIQITSAAPLPEKQPAYSYSFALKTMEEMPQDSTQKVNYPWYSKPVNLALSKLMKHISSKRRQKIIRDMNRGVRQYTLRSSWRSTENASFADIGAIDIFLHGDTAGSNWARNLKSGDVIFSQSEVADKHDHLNRGQALLLADETAFPALAALLEAWNNPLPPFVVIVSKSESDLDYFDTIESPRGTKFEPIVCPLSQQGERAVTKIADLPAIDVAWGALEYNQAKRIRHYLRNERQIEGKNNRIKAYWRLEDGACRQAGSEDYFAPA